MRPSSSVFGECDKLSPSSLPRPLPYDNDKVIIPVHKKVRNDSHVYHVMMLDIYIYTTKRLPVNPYGYWLCMWCHSHAEQAVLRVDLNIYCETYISADTPFVAIIDYWSIGDMFNLRFIGVTIGDLIIQTKGFNGFEALLCFEPKDFRVCALVCFSNYPETIGRRSTAVELLKTVIIGAYLVKVFYRPRLTNGNKIGKGRRSPIVLTTIPTR